MNVVLKAVVDISTIAELKAELIDAIDTAGNVSLDLSSVTRIDAAGLQLRCALVKHGETNGQKVKWVGHSAAIFRAASLLDLQSTLQLPEPEAE